MKNSNVYCVIMAGGIGTRFWPLSTSKFPKQFHDVLGTGKTLIQQTYERILHITDAERIYVITDKMYNDLVKKQLPDLQDYQIISEPMGMNTAPCALYSAMKIQKTDANAKILLCPSDHLIINENKFAEKVQLALDSLDQKDGLYTLGIQPTRPDTGYGYIQYIESDNPVKKVKTFTEKPNRELAEKFLLSGDFLWNSGIFVWKAQTIIEAFKKFLPDMHQAMFQIYDDLNTDIEKRKVNKVYPVLQKISIDHGIMERHKTVYVIPASFGWSDLGTWTSLYENSNRNRQRNAILGKTVKLYKSKGNLVHVAKDKAVVIEGLNNYIVIDTKNALLICPMESDQEVKNFVNDLKLSKGEKFV
ncbi:MAG: mannose-1-phosphate guanylyltransferase [Flavobacteriaceae bacterium]|nr:mannose-1-phosphate guanylyltransferase [Flavobacteriaceae bacterium]